jgi:subtilisin-like proprotein convertase family protein
MGSDANDGAGSLTYCWEQWDGEFGETMPPAGTNTQGPMFRSLDPTSANTRYFPNLPAVLAGSDPTWEELPTVSRNMEFRVSVRDNNSVYGCIGDQNVNIATSAAGGTFAVTTPTGTTNWQGGQYHLVEWNVGLTDQAPINCNQVNILLATNGQDFSTTIASNIPNDGKAYVLFPNTTNNNARLMVEAADNVFFNVNDGVINLTSSGADYSLGSAPVLIERCPNQDAVYTIQTSSSAGYNSPIALSVSGIPSGASASISPTSVTPGGSATLTISGLQNITTGVYTINVDGTSAAGSKSIPIMLSRLDGPEQIAVNAPINNASDQSINPSFDWPTESSSSTYDVELATDPGFNNIVASTNTPLTAWDPDLELSPLTTYYWRVRGIGNCGNGLWSPANAFTTSPCFTFTSSDVPVSISDMGTVTVTSTLPIGATGIVSDVNVTKLEGNHTYVSDLFFSLTSPEGTSRTLFGGLCGSLDDFNLAFNSQSTSSYSSIPCPPVNGATFRPNQSLNNFNGEEINGDWTLSISDVFDVDGGALTDWSLRICVTNYAAPLPVELLGFAVSAQEDHIQLQWQTESEQNNEGFWIQRKIDGTAGFQVIGWVPGVGDSQVRQSYAFQDMEAPRGVRCYYRLEQVDYDGKTDFSPVRSAMLEGNDSDINIFPNPTTGQLFVEVPSPNPQGLIQVFNATGQQVITRNLTGPRSGLSLHAVPKGCYWVRIQSGSQVITKRIIHQ